MAFNYAVKERTNAVGGPAPYPTPYLKRALGAANPGQKDLATDTNSADIVGPCEIHIYSGVAARIDCRLSADAASLDPANSPDVIPVGRSIFIVGPETVKLKWTALV